jgi:predicted nucleic acid-binding protein
MFVLADTGVLLRLFEPSDPQHLAVRNSIIQLESQGDEIVAAPQNIAEFWNVCTRPSSSRGGYGLDVLATDQRVQDIEMKFSILIEPVSTYSIWR